MSLEFGGPLLPERVRGYMGIMVDPKAVVTAVRGPEIDGVSRRKVAALLGTHDGVVTSLIAAGPLGFLGTSLPGFSDQIVGIPDFRDRKPPAVPDRHDAERET